MARPKKYYVVWDDCHQPHIVEGRPRNGIGQPFKTRLAAEEWAAWWRYEHPLWFTR